MTIYLDHAATTPVDPRVAQVMAGLASEYYAFADPQSPGASGVRYFWTNTLGTVYFDLTGSLSGEMDGAAGLPVGTGTVLQ